jgi:hypothetical protein
MPVMVAYSLVTAARIAASRPTWTTATMLHGQAERILEETAIRLYDDDKRASEDMLAAARRHLGDVAFETAMTSGRALDLPAAAEVADHVLADAASALADTSSE